MYAFVYLNSYIFEGLNWYIIGDNIVKMFHVFDCMTVYFKLRYACISMLNQRVTLNKL